MVLNYIEAFRVVSARQHITKKVNYNLLSYPRTCNIASLAQPVERKSHILSNLEVASSSLAGSMGSTCFFSDFTVRLLPKSNRINWEVLYVIAVMKN
jgi:hypothetical protein